MRVEDFMTRRVVTITPDTTLLAAAKLMLEHRVGGLPVVDASAPHHRRLQRERSAAREEGRGWLAMAANDGRTGREACRAAPARRAKSR